MSDSIMGVRKFRTFNVMDDYTREAIQDAYLFTDIRDSEPSPKNGSKNTTNEDPMKPYRTEHPPNGNNKFNLNLTIKPVWKKGYLHGWRLGVDRVE